MPLPTAPFRCRFQNARSVLGNLHHALNLIRSIERDFWRLSGIGKPVILLDTIPEAFASETGTEKSGH